LGDDQFGRRDLAQKTISTRLLARLEIRRLDFDAARLAAERTFDLEDHRLSLTDPTASG
jgi:hypothetical protein